MIKSIEIFLCLLGFVVFTVGCQTESEVVPNLSVVSQGGADMSGGTLIYESEGGETVFVVESNVPWTVECSADWITFSPKNSGGDAHVKMSVSKSEKSRSAVVTVSCVQDA